MSALEEDAPARPSETVAGFLAALAIFIALIGVAWHPLRLIGPAIVVSLVAAAMGGRHERLSFAAAFPVMHVCWASGHRRRGTAHARSSRPDSWTSIGSRTPTNILE